LVEMRQKSLVIYTSQRWLFNSTMLNRSIDLQQKIMQNRNCLEFINKSPDYELYGFRYPIKMLGNQNQLPIFPKHYLPITFVSIEGTLTLETGGKGIKHGGEGTAAT